MSDPWKADLPIREDNIINESERSVDPADDEYKLVKLESDGRISPEFTTDSIVFGTAGEDLSAKDSVCIPVDTSDPVTYNATTGTQVPNTLQTGDRVGSIYKVFVPKEISNVQTRFALVSGTSGSTDFTIEIYEVDGSNNPTGSAIATSSTTTAPTSGGNATFSFASPVQLDDKNYALIAHCVENLGTRRYRLEGGGTPQLFVKTVVNTGSGWSDTTVAMRLILGDVDIVENGKMYKTSAAYDFMTEKFIGFVGKSADKNEIVRVSSRTLRDDDIVLNQEYFLSNTFGEIATTAGSTSKEIGVGTAEDILTIYNDAKYF
jgi:hypothetical protein